MCPQFDSGSCHQDLDACSQASIFIYMILRNLRFPVTLSYELDSEVARKLGCSKNHFSILRIIRKAVDTRKKNQPFYDFTLELDFNGKAPVHKDLFANPEQKYKPLPRKHVDDPSPYIIGMGPAGLFAALAMVENGLRPVLFEQGESISQRSVLVDRFWRTGVLDQNSNVQFGEGGAGAFSDGKLTNRGMSPGIARVFDLLIGFGAPPDITYDALPHLGTEGIRKVVINIRRHLLDHGCQIHYRQKLEDIVISNGRIKSITINGVTHNPDKLVLAIGNSARQTFRMLQKAGIAIEAKSFAMGVRIEHPQDLIDRLVYGNEKWHSILGPATYRMVDSASGTYTFCMCPGGQIIASSSEQNSIVTNGMSYSKRSSHLANSAIVTAIDNTIFGDSALSGMEFQRKLEQKAFESDHSAPIQNAVDFIKGKSGNPIRDCSYRPQSRIADIGAILPSRIGNSIKKALQKFDKIFCGFLSEGLLCAPETRTSSPVRIVRDGLCFASISADNLFPVGEGSGYAGGIVSSAADGYKLGKSFFY